MAQGTVDLDTLTMDQQLELLDRLWERLGRDPASLPLTQEQERELDARDDQLEQDIRSGRPLGAPWSEVRKRFE
jgi:putative addiction module component (TIGR02574 family)